MLREPQTQDEEQLTVLAVFHFVIAGILFLISFLPLFYIAFGLVMMSGVARDPGGDAFLRSFGWMIVFFGALFFLYQAGFATLVAFAGAFLLRRTRYLFCLVVAGLTCTFTPLGTVLGIFTVIVLARESVRELFRYGRGLHAPADTDATES